MSETPFALNLGHIFNSKGMVANSSYCIWSRPPHSEYVAFDILGAETAVKAIHAAIFQGRGNGNLSFKFRGQNERLHKSEDESSSYVTKKEILLKDPNYYRWHIGIDLPKNSVYRYIWSFEKDTVVIQHQFFLAFQKSIFPIQRNWVLPMIERGRNENAIIGLSHTSAIRSAYRIEMTSWQKILNDMLQEGVIQVDDIKETT